MADTSRRTVASESAVCFVADAGGTCGDEVLRAAVALHDRRRIVIGDARGPLAAAVRDREPLREGALLRPLAFQLEAHARSHAIFEALRRRVEREPVVAALFASAEDAFCAVEAKRLSGAFESTALVVAHGALDDRDDRLTTRDGILSGALRDRALASADWILGADASGAAVDRAVRAAELPRVLAEHARTGSPVAGPQPLVSIVVPHYNLGGLVRETVASALASTYPRVEVVVVDDGSTDAGSLATVRALAAPRVHVVEKRNGGLASARNAGVRAASGELILPLDADDLVDPGYVAAAVEAHRRAPGLAFVTCHAAFFRRRPGDMPGEGWVPVGLHAPALLFGNCASTCSAVIRRDALEEAGGFDESWDAYEDWDLWCTMAERGFSAGVLPEVLFHYRIRPKSMVRTTARERDRELRSRMVRRHPALARAHATAAFLAHVAACSSPDLRILPGTRR